MKTLYFSRHAKSDWGDFRLADVDRPLNERGKRDGPIMANEVKKRVQNIDICISSIAKRARSTAKYYKKVFDFKLKIKEPRVYEAYTSQILLLISELPDSYDSAIFFGHNPTFTQIYDHFSDHELDNLPTSGVFSVHSTAQSWKDINENNSEIGFLLFPKMYD
jgi:phosphohistidine phosphatase